MKRLLSSGAADRSHYCWANFLPPLASCLHSYPSDTHTYIYTLTHSSNSIPKLPSSRWHLVIKNCTGSAQSHLHSIKFSFFQGNKTAVLWNFENPYSLTHARTKWWSWAKRSIRISMIEIENHFIAVGQWREKNKCNSIHLQFSNNVTLATLTTKAWVRFLPDGHSGMRQLLMLCSISPEQCRTLPSPDSIRLLLVLVERDPHEAEQELHEPQVLHIHWSRLNGEQ